MTPSAVPSALALMASNAAASFGLVADDIYDGAVDYGLRQGEVLCAFLADGVAAESSSTFSVRTIEAMRAVALLRAIPEGERFVADSPRMRDEIKEARAALAAGAVTDESGVAWRALRDRLFRLSAILTYTCVPRVGCRP